MNAIENAPPRTMTTGVTVVAALPMPDADARAIVRAIASASGADRVWDADDDSLGTLAFAVGPAAALTIARREAPDVASDRPDLALLLGASVHDVIRLDVMLQRPVPAAFARADAALVAIADSLVRTFGAVVVDDLGSVFDPAELARLASSGLPRALAFSYQLAVARRAVASEPLDIVPPPVPDTSGREAPAGPSPDGATAARVVFGAIGPHLPLVQLARVTLALAGDARTNAARRPVTVDAPAIAASEGLRLAALGVELNVTTAAREEPRDEVDVLACELTADDAIAVLETFARELIAERVEGPIAVLPRLVSIGRVLAAGAGGFPHAVASFDFDEVAVTVSYLDLTSADEIFVKFVRSRRDLMVLLGADAGAAVAIELSGPASGAESEYGRAVRNAADALATALAHAFVARTHGLATDATGAVYGEDELAALVADRRGRAASWSFRVATARLAGG